MLLFPWPKHVIHSQLGPSLAGPSPGLLLSLGMCVVLSSGFLNIVLPATKEPNPSRFTCFDEGFVLDTVCSFY